MNTTNTAYRHAELLAKRAMLERRMEAIRAGRFTVDWEFLTAVSHDISRGVSLSRLVARRYVDEMGKIQKISRVIDALMFSDTDESLAIKASITAIDETLRETLCETLSGTENEGKKHGQNKHFFTRFFAWFSR